MLQNRPFFADLIRHKLAIILLARVLNLKCCTGTLSETKLIRGSVMKTKIVVVVFVCLFAASAVAISMLVPADAQAAEKINAKAGGDKVPPGLRKIPPGLEKIVFIHYKKEHVKPDRPAKPEKPGKPSAEAACYDFMGRGVQWKDEDLPISCVIDPDLANAIDLSAIEWEKVTQATLFDFKSFDTGDDLSWDGDVPDGLNEMVIGDYPDDRVIAVTVVWGYFSGPPSIRKIFEFDILFVAGYNWGNADDVETVMDLQNIATHEIGHGLGLADIYDEAQCSEVTMYGYSTEGETKKRTLEEPDITGIQELYGTPAAE
jgi:hypothetical protein